MPRGCLALLLAMASMLSVFSRAEAQTTADHYALLMVWMPGLCALETERPECKDLSLQRYDGQHLSFMALELAHESGISDTFCFSMPSDFEMDHSRDWCDMSKPNLDPSLAAQLKQLMPIAQSCQDRGLWARYASCTMYSAGDYYTRGFKLARAVAATKVNLKVAGAIGQTASQQALVAAFEEDFGDETGSAIDFICRKIAGKSHLVNVKITVTAKALTRGLGKEFLWKPTRTLRRSCPENIVVDAPPGAQIGTPAANAAPTPPPAKPNAPTEPAAPERVPVEPVETTPLSPPDGPKSFPIPAPVPAR
jgi:ribonuclease I